MKFFILFLIVCASLTALSLAASEDELAARRKAIEAVFDFTKGTSDICPVHKVKMPVKVVPVTYGLPVIYSPEVRKKQAEFPFSEEFILLGDCVAPDETLFPKTGKVLVCPKCVAGWNSWLDATRKNVAKSKPK